MTDYLQKSYYLVIDRFQAESCLANQPVGTFLIRPSTRGTSYISTSYVDSSHQVVHGSIKIENNTYIHDDSTFDSLDSLIDNYDHLLRFPYTGASRRTTPITGQTYVSPSPTKRSEASITKSSTSSSSSSMSSSADSISSGDVPSPNALSTEFTSSVSPSSSSTFTSMSRATPDFNASRNSSSLSKSFDLDKEAKKKLKQEMREIYREKFNRKFEEEFKKKKQEIEEKENYIKIKETQVRTCPTYWLSKVSLKDWGLDEFYKLPVKTTLLEKMQTEFINRTCTPKWIGIGKDSHKLKHINGFILKRAERIEHGRLWKRYKDRLEEILLDPNVSYVKILTENAELNEMFGLKPSFNECYLFHGTSKAIVDLILHQGFTEKVGSLKGMFGSGVYFSENSSKSDEYAKEDENGFCYMFLSRVCLGKPYIAKSENEVKELSTKQLRRAPFLPGLDPTKLTSLANCVIGDAGDQCYLKRYREFVVYDGAQCYPEFLLTYQRTTSNNPRAMPLLT